MSSNFPSSQRAHLASLCLGGIAILLLSRAGRSAARLTAMVFATAAVAYTLMLWCRFQPALAGMQFQERHAWEPAVGLDYHVGLDGLSLLMLAVSSIVVLMSVAASWSNSKQGPVYFSLLLFLETGLFGTYTALNFLHWFLFWELSLIPAFFMIRLWGGCRTRAGGNPIFCLHHGGQHNFAAGVSRSLSRHRQLRLYPVDPDGADRAARRGHWTKPALAPMGQRPHHHVPVLRRISGIRGQDAGGSLSRLAGFRLCGSGAGDHHGADRRAVENGRVWLSQDPASHLSRSRCGVPEPFFYGWPSPAIVLPAFTAWAQTDLKRMFAYSSINHLGYCILGIAAVTGSTGADASQVSDKAAALTGVMLQLFSHGITAAALFWFLALLERRSGGLTGPA